MNFPILIKCAKNFTKNLLSVGLKTVNPYKHGISVQYRSEISYIQ